GQPESARQKSREQLSEYLKFAVANLSDLRELAILDLDGNVVLSTDRLSEGQNWGQEPFFIQGRSVLYVQNVYSSPRNGEPMMSIAMPLFDSSRRRVAVLVCHLNIERLDRIMLERSGLNMRGEVYLLNSDRQFVSVSPARQRRFGNPHSFGIDEALAHKDGFGEYINYAGDPVIGVYRWLDHRELALLVETPRPPVYDPARRLMFNLIIIGGITGAFLVAGLVFFSRRVMRKMRLLYQSGSQVLGDHSEEATMVSDEDEMSSLNRVFLKMSDKIRGQQNEIRSQAEAFDKTRQILQRNEAHLRALVDHLPDVLIQIKRGGDILYLSPSVKDVLGYQPEELLGQDIMDYILPEDWASIREIMHDLRDHPLQLRRFEIRFRHKDGVYRAMEVLGKSVRDEELTVLLSLRDITRRRWRK
ncbi:MAG: PAS domain S-box protein, partial [Anaerolineales bacterium]